MKIGSRTMVRATFLVALFFAFKTCLKTIKINFVVLLNLVIFAFAIIKLLGHAVSTYIFIE